MKSSSGHIRFAASAAGVMLFAALLFSASDAVHKCEVEEKKWSAENRPHSRLGYAMRLYRRVHVNVVCGAGADDVWVALSGVAVAAFTFTLWRSTEKLWKSAESQRISDEHQRHNDLLSRRYSEEQMSRSITAAVKAADAAERQSITARDAMIANNRPHLIFQTSFNRSDTYDFKTDETPFIKYMFYNYGNSPAIIQFSFNDIIVSDVTIDAEYADHEDLVRHYFILKADTGTDWTKVTFSGAPITVHDRDLISRGCKYVWVVGKTVYFGVLGSMHETKFCWRYNPDTREFQEYGGPIYNRRT